MSANDFYWMPNSLLDAINEQRLSTHARTILDRLLGQLLTSNSEYIAQHGIQHSVRSLAEDLRLLPTQVDRGLKVLLRLGIVSCTTEPKDRRLWVIHPSRWTANTNALSKELPWVEYANERRLILGPVPDETESWIYPDKSERPEDSDADKVRRIDVLFLSLYENGREMALTEVVPRILNVEYPGWQQPNYNITRRDIVAAVKARLKSMDERRQIYENADIKMVLEYVATNHVELAAYEAARIRLNALRSAGEIF